MKLPCPKCKFPTESSVINSRSNTIETYIRRRRECDLCGTRYTTQEIVNSERQKRERFDRLLCNIWAAASTNGMDSSYVRGALMTLYQVMTLDRQPRKANEILWLELVARERFKRDVPMFLRRQAI